MRTKLYPSLLATCLLLWAPTALQAQPGALDPTFNGTGYIIEPVNGSDATQKILVQPDQKVLVIGMSFNASFTSSAQVFRYLPDGSPDTEFGTGGVFSFQQDFEANLYSAVLTPEGKIVLVGSTTDYQGYRMLLIQLNENGTLDTAFGTDGVVLQTVTPVPANGEDMAYDVVLDADNNLLVSGSSFGEDYINRPVVVRFTPDGTLDTTFGVNGVATIPTGDYPCDFKGIVVQPDGKIVAAGTYGDGLLFWVLLLVRFEADGSLDPDFGDAGVVKYNYGNVDDEAEDLTLLADGSILVAGFTVSVDYNYSALLLKFTPEGVLDASFSDDGSVEEDLTGFDYAWDVVEMPDGTIIVSGTSGQAPPGAFDLAVWKYTANGTRDDTFGINGLVQHQIPGHSTMIYAMDVQADGNILVGGQARTEANQNYFFTARLQNDIASGIADLAASSQAFVFPNPASVGTTITLQVAAPISTSAQLSIHAADGRLVGTYAANQFQRTAQGIAFQLPTHLAPGIYQLALQQQGTRLTATMLVTD